MRLYLVCLASGAASLAGWLIASGAELHPVPIMVALAVLGIVAERGSIRLSSTVEVSVSSLPALFAAIVLGPLPAMIVAAASLLGDFRKPYMKWAVYTSSAAATAGITGLVASHAWDLGDSGLSSAAIATAIAVPVSQTLNLGFAALTMHLRRSSSAWSVVQTFLPVMASSVLLWIALVAPLVIAYTETSPWAVMLFLFPALAAQRLLAMYQEQRRLATDLGIANQGLERANLSFASALVTTLDARDRYTAGHSAAVAIYTRDIAADLGLPLETQLLAHLSGLLHDIGKVGVPPGILEKNGPLTLSERWLMEEHSVVGERILANVEAYAEIATIVRHHHERLDGQGYPDGLEGESIPLLSRVICVADAYNAMTSDRPYRTAMPVAVARSRLRESAGAQFDEKVVAAFDAILDSATDTYSSGARADFAIEAQAHPALRRDVDASAA